jgi:cell division protein FtsI (penicillin-binding protein 3)
VVEAIRKLDLPGVVLEPVDLREYPMGSLAAHVLGGIRSDNVGLEGVELQFEQTLRGKDGFKRSLKDARRRAIATAAEDYVPPINGTHVILSIDSSIQLIAEQELAATCEQFRARAGETIVMDPHTGEILAMANWPAFNPANLDDSKPDTRRNRCLTDPYEPGSTIKPFIVGPAYAAKWARPTDQFHIPGPYKSPMRAKLVTDVHYYGELALWDVMVKSSNIGMVQLGERLGADKLYTAITSFAFGKRTGIELPGEDPGLINPLKKWTKPSPVSIAMGYEMMVTPLQLIRGACTYANGGKLVTPTIVHGTIDHDGRVQPRLKAANSKNAQVIDGPTSELIRRIMCDVVVRGTGTKARSDRWNVFGKTGTAHTAKGGSYNESNYTSSFVGGAPFENPRLVVAVIIHDPDKSVAHFGGTVSAPAAGAILERSLSYLQIPPSPELRPPPAQIANVLHAFDPRVYERKSDGQVSAR